MSLYELSELGGMSIWFVAFSYFIYVMFQGKKGKQFATKLAIITFCTCIIIKVGTFYI